MKQPLDTPAEKKKGSFFAVLFTYFIDNLGWAIVFPILAPLFLDPDNVLFPPDISLTGRTLAFGLFLAVYSFGQFLGAPLLGEFADRAGRKKALLLSILCSTAGYMFSALAVQGQSLVLLFISRFITGLFSGNVSVCLASITDMSRNEIAKIKNFGYISVLGGISFILGSFLGGQFSDTGISLYFSPALPFWIGCGLNFINLILLFFLFVETQDGSKDKRYDLLEGVHNVEEALRIKKLKIIFIVYFMFILGWTILFQFAPMLLVKKFVLSNSKIGMVASIMGVCWAGGAYFANKFLSRRFDSGRILEFCLIGFVVLCGAVVLPQHVTEVVILLGLCIFIGGAAWPICTGIISGLAKRQGQGKILGVGQSVQSLAMAIGPIVGGFAANWHGYLPFAIASFACLGSAILYFREKF